MENPWTQEQISKKIKEEFDKGFTDMFLFGETAYRIKDGNLEHIPFPIGLGVFGYPEDSGDCTTEIKELSISDIIDKFGEFLSDEELNILNLEITKKDKQ